MRDQITIAEWAALEDAQWRDTLAKAWRPGFISLSAAVNWIAAKGDPRECGCDELNGAASELVDKLRSGDIIAFGAHRHEVERREAPPITFDRAMDFFGDIESLPTDDGAPTLFWNPMLDGACDDKIRMWRADIILWRDLVISRADILRVWSTKTVAAPATEAPKSRSRSWITSPLVSALRDIFPTEPTGTNAAIADRVEKVRPDLVPINLRRLGEARRRAFS
jgi:hypothetical protein